jgi:hypothetical protein
MVCTLAYQLGLFHPLIGKLLSIAIKPTIMLSPIPHQFKTLFVDRESLPVNSKIILVSDAFDVCSTPNDRRTLEHTRRTIH